MEVKESPEQCLFEILYRSFRTKESKIKMKRPLALAARACHLYNLIKPNPTSMRLLIAITSFKVSSSR